MVVLTSRYLSIANCWIGVRTGPQTCIPTNWGLAWSSIVQKWYWGINSCKTSWTILTENSQIILHCITWTSCWWTCWPNTKADLAKARDVLYTIKYKDSDECLTLHVHALGQHISIANKPDIIYTSPGKPFKALRLFVFFQIAEVRLWHRSAVKRDFDKTSSLACVHITPQH